MTSEDYERGYADGESNHHADWQFALDVDGDLLPDGVEVWPAQVAAYIERLSRAARHLLDSVSPFHSALEVEHGADGKHLFGDLAEALGLPRDYGSDDYRDRTKRAEGVADPRAETDTDG